MTNFNFIFDTICVPYILPEVHFRMNIAFHDTPFMWYTLLDRYVTMWYTRRIKSINAINQSMQSINQCNQSIQSINTIDQSINQSMQSIDQVNRSIIYVIRHHYHGFVTFHSCRRQKAIWHILIDLLFVTLSMQNFLKLVSEILAHLINWNLYDLSYSNLIVNMKSVKILMCYLLTRKSISLLLYLWIILLFKALLYLTIKWNGLNILQ